MAAVLSARVIGTVALPVAFGFVQVDYEMPYTLGQTWYWFVFFLPGMVTFLYGSHFLEPLWSIGVEEVFLSDVGAAV